MRFLNYLKDEYVFTLQSRKDPYGVYKNPDIEDFKELEIQLRKDGSKDLDVRFIADLAKRNLYVWDGTKSIHWDVEHYLQSHDNLSSNTIADSGIIANHRIYSNGFIASIRKRSPVLDWTKKYMMVSSHMNEEYVTRITTRDTLHGVGEADFEIYVNPDTSEIKGIKKKFVRCIADFKKKDLYVFGYDLLHSEAIRVLHKEKGLYEWPGLQDPKNNFTKYYSLCTAKVFPDGKLKMYTTDTGEGMFRREILNKVKWTKMDDTWLNRWFTAPYTESYIEACRNPKEWL